MKHQLLIWGMTLLLVGCQENPNIEDGFNNREQEENLVKEETRL